MDSVLKLQRGRPSKKRDALFNLYSLLRCAMDDDDIAVLQGQHSDFRDMTSHNKDTEIQKAINWMSDAMRAVQAPDITRSEPLRRV